MNCANFWNIVTSIFDKKRQEQFNDFFLCCLKNVLLNFGEKIII